MSTLGILTLAPGLPVQNSQNNDKILIYTSDGKCVDYFITEPSDILGQGLRTGEAPCKQTVYTYTF